MSANREQSVSSITTPAGGDTSAVPSPRPTSDPARLESPADAGEHVLWSDVADGTVQANVVVMLHIDVRDLVVDFVRR
ncbi:MAG TPA: hypothetical protein VKD70_14490 [Candidatus Acidoferrum sp.]|nr:hypothetical protein [Candidatus Acidoferrum sp.]